MYRQRVESSAIKEIGYNPEKEVLEVMFVNEQIYQYVRLSFERYSELMGAESIGSHFMRNIKPHHPCVRVH